MPLSFADELVPVASSERAAWPGAKRLGAVDPDKEIEVTVWLRPREGGEIDLVEAQAIGEILPRRRAYTAREDLRRKTAAAPADIELLRAYLEHRHVAVVQTAWRCVVARGTIGALSHAFGTKLHVWAEGGLHFRQRTGPLRVKGELAEIVRGAFGLDDWPNLHASRGHPAAQPAKEAAPEAPEPLTAEGLARAYAFPEDADGSGQTIGIVHFGGRFVPEDFDESLRLQGVWRPSVLTRNVRGAAGAFADATEFDEELALDTQVAAWLAPGAKLVLYGAPHNERGFLDVVRAALFDEEQQPSILSISYGRPECCWTPAALALLDELFAAAALLGVSVFCASGDRGTDEEIDGKPHVHAPASSPFVHGCGGTHVDIVEGKRVESAWRQTGGGFSERADGPPSWQSVALRQAVTLHARRGRGVPDVAAQAFPPGYRIVVNRKKMFTGGTSAATPLWSALTARLNERLRTPLGFFAPLLYAKAEEAPLFRPIAKGGNGRYAAHEGWKWNPCTGLGSPIGTSIERAFEATAGEFG